MKHKANSLTTTLIISLSLLSICKVYSNEEKDSEFYEGERKLPYEQRITAEGRYYNLRKQIKCTEDKDEIVNQLLYIKNGYYDVGYLPEQDEHCGSKKLPDGFWVYVYPHWFIWKGQKLF